MAVALAAAAVVGFGSSSGEFSSAKPSVNQQQQHHIHDNTSRRDKCFGAIVAIGML